MPRLPPLITVLQGGLKTTKQLVEYNQIITNIGKEFAHSITMHKFLVLLSLFLSLLGTGQTQPTHTALIPQTASGVHSSLPAENLARFPSLREFIPSIQNGRASQLVGVYADDAFALRIVQQPASNPGFVSSEPEVVTEFSMAANYGTTGLLAHNTEAGEYFDDIKAGQNIVLVYGDGDLGYYKVDQIREFQALTPTSPYSSFVDLSAPDQTLSAENLFYQVYQSDGNLVFQTCIERDGDLSWGRLFIIASPMDEPGHIHISALPGELIQTLR